MRNASLLGLLLLASFVQACSSDVESTSTASTDPTAAPGGSAGKGGSGGAGGTNGGKGGASGKGGTGGGTGGSTSTCDSFTCQYGHINSASCPGTPFTTCTGSSVECVPLGQSCPAGTGAGGGAGGSAGAGAGTGGGGAAGACADVKAGAACDAAAPDCDLADGLVASCVQGAWWVGVLAGPASDATPCSPYGTWALAYGPASGWACGVSKPETMEIRPVHAGTKRAVRFGSATTASLPLDGCSVKASLTESFSGMEFGSTTLTVAVTFADPVKGSYGVSGMAFCAAAPVTRDLTVTKQ